MLTGFIEKHGLGHSFTQIAQEWFIPLAETIQAHHNSANRTFFVGINGCQGSGKSTLSDFLKVYLQDNYQLKVLVLSLDDFYYSKSDRLSLAIKVHPLFETRGVPGTHNMTHAGQLLEQLAIPGLQLSIPRFDKANDDPFDESTWPTVSTPVDVVIFEGWCWGVQPQLTSQLQQPVNDLEVNEDPMGVWRQYVNRQLEQQYQPLYKKMDFWLMLKAPGFEHVLNWRLEQEEKLAKSLNTDLNGNSSDNKLMDKSKIRTFIQHYQRLTEHALQTLPQQCDQVFELDEFRNITDAIVRD